MTADDWYLGLLREAVEPYEVRGHECRRVPRVVDVTFTNTPLITARRVAWRTCLREFEWFMSGSTSLKDLHPDARPWWTPWGDGSGYGKGGLDRAPFSIWDPTNKLPPCAYTGLVVSVRQDGVHVYTAQRSCDLVCGAPHDWFQLWAYGLWLAREAQKPLHSVRWFCPDAHVYDAHRDVIDATLRSRPTQGPEVAYAPSGKAFRADDFYLCGPYTPSLTMKAELIV